MIDLTTKSRYLSALAVLSLLFTVHFSGCGGSRGMASPQVYGDRNHNAEQSGGQDQVAAVDSASSVIASDTLSGRKEENRSTHVDPSPAIEDQGSGTKVSDQKLKQEAIRRELSKPNNDNIEPVDQYYARVDNIDSAAAVDDIIWRRFDLAEEYHAMGVIANREASWEEAQYYFEKCLTILANLDIESDSIMTPEAVKYDAILDNVVAEYRVALRSLGQLVGETGPSVLVERFGELEAKLGRDSLLVYKQERSPITYDLPVVINDRVKSSIIYFQTVAKENFTRYLQRSKRYERLFLEVLTEYGLPHDLIYLSLVESGFNPGAYSWARAMGLWQFISSTGRMYGLNRNWWMDERKDPVKSTHAAARFLKDLYKQFGNWELAMAAYNGGPNRVKRTIKKQKTIDFWKMRLKRQTMDYVPLIYAAAIISKDPERYGFSQPEFEPEVVWDNVEVNRCIDLKTVAAEVGCSLKEMKRLNPELLRNYTPPNVKKYSLKIPVGSKHKFLAAYDSMPSPKETSWVKHRITRGQTVSTIAARYGVSQYAIFEANNLSRRSRIFAGKTLIVPVPLDRAYASSRKQKKSYAADGSIYSVRAGDTMWDIARAFGTTVSGLRRINYIERGSRIYVGQKLRIPSDATKFKTASKSSRQLAARTESSSSPAPTKSSGSKKSYTVRAGDTLWDIARMFGTTTSRIRNLNGLGRSSRIYPGQKLTVQSKSGVNYVIHKIKKGETLGRIARMYRTTISRILANNSLTDPDDIQVGDNLKVYIK